jgi:hypothetical protein
MKSTLSAEVVRSDEYLRGSGDLPTTLSGRVAGMPWLSLTDHLFSNQRLARNFRVRLGTGGDVAYQPHNVAAPEETGWRQG